ncbi:PD40 domain-containing protein [Robiginitalea sp. SC105]|uniref:PD40 domain-containing protein n=1 Tax=Robiginitalea sp. SC105 TaxID=2762332 RepID=UPI00163A5493|nr:PD40 domain-containing protein [Robiginitalea sp. SC105]MBC2840413.1 PD40 domain-containing protein [Robiginitalea sp. SC105]
MKRIIALKNLLGFLSLLCAFGLTAQSGSMADAQLSASAEADKRVDDYLKLAKLGYSEREIYEDLGNVNFLTENYESAAFWYQKLVDLAGIRALPESYQERYKYAMHKAGIIQYSEVVAQRDWVSRIKEDYQIERSTHAAQLTRSLAENYKMPDFGRADTYPNTEGLEALRAMSEADLVQMQSERMAVQNAYMPPVSVTADGRTAYFSKAVFEKPLYGIFSKKQLVHKIFRAENVNGQWANIQEVAVAPKYASAMHPAVSSDGTRLYFASDMPGTYGKYDIYVADIRRDGSPGAARNLGEKINTRKNDLYPSLVGGDILFFASDGHAGFGGLDLYAARIARRSVGLAINIGSPFNSGEDEFALNLQTDEGMAYVMSNRGAARDDIHQLVFSYYDTEQRSLADNRYTFKEILANEPSQSYVNTMFED